MQDDTRFRGDSERVGALPLRHRHLGRWIVLAPVAALSIACGGGDASSAPPDGVGQSEPVAASSQAIYGGTRDNDAEASAAVVALRVDATTTSFELCSGALIAPNVVLTARHCVSKNITSAIACDETGASNNGAHFGDDDAPSSIHVFTGASPDLQNGAPAANGKRIFHPASTVLCNVDIALIVLDRSVTGITPLKVRLSGGVAPRETLRSVGYGENDAALPLGTRLRRAGVVIEAVGAAVSSHGTPLASREFEVGESICQGDSGGPALSERSGAVIGVVSRGGDCGLGYGHVYTQTGGFDALFRDAFAVAGGAPVDEGLVATDAGAGAVSGDGTGAEPAAAADAGPARAPLNLRAGANDGACAARVAGHGGDGAHAAGSTALLSGLAAVAMARRRNRRARRSHLPR
jgi:hypothetical protein